MTDYTPTTEEAPVRVTDGSVRECVMYANLLLRGESTNSIGTPLTVEISKKYDDWLTDHDRKIAAEALREYVATGAFGVFYGEEIGGRRAMFQAAMPGDLLAHALRIEQGDES